MLLSEVTEYCTLTFCSFLTMCQSNSHAVYVLLISMHVAAFCFLQVDLVC